MITNYSEGYRAPISEAKCPHKYDAGANEIQPATVPSMVGVSFPKTFCRAKSRNRKANSAPSSTIGEKVHDADEEISGLCRHVGAPRWLPILSLSAMRGGNP
jgi:hypothetical protein